MLLVRDFCAVKAVKSVFGHGGRNQRMPQEPELTPHHPATPPSFAEVAAEFHDPAPTADTREVGLEETRMQEKSFTLPAAEPVDAAKHMPQRIPRWLVRSELFLRVVLRMYVGLAVCYAPWNHAFWDQNPLFTHFPALGAFAANGAVKGLVSGLGILNLWIAFQDAIHSGMGRRKGTRD